MRVLRRIPAALVLLLQFAVGARPLAGTGQLENPAGGHHVITAVIPDCHKVASESGSAPDTVQGDHSAHAEHVASVETALSSDEQSSEEPADEHRSHHDAGCHGAPCCAPVVPGNVVRAVATLDVPVDRLRPNTGAARIVFADGARRRPPATAPPVA